MPGSVASWAVSSDSCVLPCGARQPTAVRQAACLILPKFSLPQRTAASKKQFDAFSNCFVTGSWCRCCVFELSRGARYFCRCWRGWETALYSYKCWYWAGAGAGRWAVDPPPPEYNPITDAAIISLLLRLAPVQSWGDLDPGTNTSIRVRDSSLIFPHLSSLLGSCIMLQKHSSYQQSIDSVCLPSAWLKHLHGQVATFQFLSRNAAPGHIATTGEQGTAALFNSNPISKRLF